MLQRLTSQVGGSMHQLSCRRALLIAMTFQLTIVPSKLQNAPGYIGCFRDGYYRVLPEGPKTSPTQSVEWCFKYCLDGLSIGYKYAGLEYYDECFCGSNENYNKHGQSPESECEDVCEGYDQQTCGGGDRLSMYRISQGVCSNDIGPPINGRHTIANPRSLSYNLNNFKLFGTRVDFNCDTGYTLQGTSSIECIDTGNNNVTWSKPVPICMPTDDVITNLPSTHGVMPTTAIPQTTAATDPAYNSSGTISKAPPSASSSTEVSGTYAGTNGPQYTGQLETGTMVGIAAGGGVALILLVVIVIILRRNRQKKSSNVAMDAAGTTFSNNAYGLPENINQLNTEPNQATPPMYSQVIRNKPVSDDVYANPGDVNHTEDTATNEQQPCGKLLASSATAPDYSDTCTMLYVNTSFTTESKARNSSLDCQANPAPPLTMQGQPGWVENTIYE